LGIGKTALAREMAKRRIVPAADQDLKDSLPLRVVGTLRFERDQPDLDCVRRCLVQLAQSLPDFSEVIESALF
jgi:hypothetical protein